MSDVTKRIIDARRLDPQILVVAVRGFADDWAAYICPVKSLKYEVDLKVAAETGTKLSETIARAVFPAIPKELRYRD